MSLQHCCWASHRIAEQVTIVNLVDLRGSWGIFCIITWNRIGDKPFYIYIDIIMATHGWSVANTEGDCNVSIYMYIYIFRAITITLRISYRSPVSSHYIYIYLYIKWLVAYSIPSYYKKNPSRPTQSKATKLTVVTWCAIWCEAQQQCWRLIATFENEHMCYLCSWLCIHDQINMHTCILNYVYMQDNYVYTYTQLCIHVYLIMYTCIDNYVYMYT